MADAPQHRDLTPESIRREKEAAANSKPYWCHPSVTTYQYKAMSRAQQEVVQRECRQIEQAKQNNK